MEIKRKTVDLKEERDLLQGLLFHDTFCKDIVPMLSDTYILQSSHIRQLVKWCKDYYLNFGNAPKEHIWDILESEKRGMKEDYVESMEMILNSIDQTIAFDASFFVRETKKYIDVRNIELTCSQAMGHIKKGETEKAEKAMVDFKKIDKGIGMGVDIINDVTIAEKSLEVEDSLVDFYGAFGELIGRNCRGDIIGLSASTKKGKTWILIEMARQAYLDGLNVVFFSLEMEERIMAQRIFSSLTGKSYTNEESDLRISAFNKDVLEERYIELNKITLNDIVKTQSLLRRDNHVGSIRLFGPEDSGITMSSMRTAIENLYDYEGIKPDVIIFDYDALIASENGMGRESWEKENNKWLRAKFEFAHKMNCLVVMASQLGGAEAFSNEGKMENIAGSKSKPQHVSHWLILNQTPAEKRLGLMRIANTASRHGKFDADDAVVVTQCLDIGRGILDSRWVKEVDNYEDFVNGVVDYDE